jgi:hypothetical protein
MHGWELIYRFSPGQFQVIDLLALHRISENIAERGEYRALHFQFAALVEAVCRSEPPEIAWRTLAIRGEY